MAHINQTAAKRPRGRRPLRALIGTVIVSTVLPWNIPTAGAESTVFEPPLVVNVSDSYGAGNGSTVYVETECFTSPDNFAQQVTRQIGGEFGIDLSCGGATSTELRDGNVAGTIKGVNNDPWVAANGGDVDLVFTSMGGNDANFKEIVEFCLVLPPIQDTDGNSVCGARLAEAQRLLDDGTIIGSVRQTLTAIRAKMPNAVVVLVGYPNLTVGDEAVRQLLKTYTDQESGLINELRQVDADRWLFVDRRDLFAGHEVGSADPWIWSAMDKLPNDLYVDDLYHPKPAGWRATAGLLSSMPPISGMSFESAARNTIVRYKDGPDAWWVGADGVRHSLLDGGAFECAYASGGERLLLASREEIDRLPLGDPAQPTCEQPAPGDVIVDGAGHAWVTSLSAIDSGELVLRVRTPIPTEAAYRCLVNFVGSPVHHVLPETLKTYHERGTGFFCLDPSEVDNRIVVDPDTNESYLLQFDGEYVRRRSIVDTESFYCLQRTFGDANRAYAHGDIIDATNVREGNPAPRCLPWWNYEGKILESEGKQVLVTSNGERGVRDGGTSRCLTEWKGATVVPVDRTLFDSVPLDPAGWATCDPGVADGTIIRDAATGWSARKYTGADGGAFLAPIVTSETFRCLQGLGVPVLNVTGRQIEAFVKGFTSEAECVNTVAYKGRVVAGPTAAAKSLVDPVDGTLRPIDSGGVYLCLTLWQGLKLHDEVFSAAQLAKFTPGSKATCNATNVARGKVVTSTVGNVSIFVDSSGIAHKIRTTNAYGCLTEQGVATMAVATTEWLDAFAYGADQPGCDKILKAPSGSYRELANGDLLSIPDTMSFYCYADRLPAYRQVNVNDATITTLGVDGAAARCLSPTRYENKIVRDSNGRAGIVLGGSWRNIPDGHSWSCYLNRGYAIGEMSTTPVHLDSLPKGTRMPYCLNPNSFRNVMLRLADGTVFKTDGNACRYWVGNGWTMERLQEWGVPLVADGLNGEHANSLPHCGTHPYLFSQTSFRNTLIMQSNGTVWVTDGNGCRRWVKDWLTVERLNELGYGFRHTSAAQSEVDSLPYCGTQRYLLANWRVNNRVVRGPDGTSWFVRNGEWFWISSGSLWNHLVSRYGLAPGTYGYTWEHIDSLKWDRGRWAWFWM